MASLFNTKISNTYVGLIKTIDNAVISASLRELTDGSGNQTGVYLNNAGDFKASGTLEFGSLKDTGENITITKFVDEADGIASNDNDTTIPTSAAVVDYVAARITLEDLDFSGDSGTGSVDLDSQTFAVVGTANEIETSAGSQQLQIGLPDNVTIGGNLQVNGLLKGNNNIVVKDTSDRTMAAFYGGGKVELYFNDSKKLESTSDGITITGGLTATGGSVFTGATFSSDVDFADDARARFGTDNDAFIKHTGTEFQINNSTGQTDIRSSSKILLTASNGDNMAQLINSGAVDLYFNNNRKISTTNTGIDVVGDVIASGDVRVPDGEFLSSGNSNDLTITNTGSEALITNYTGNFTIQNLSDDNDIIFKSDDGSGGSATYFYVDGSGTRTIFEKLTRHDDSVNANFGSDSDLRIYHDGTNSYIEQSTGATGDLIIQQKVDDKDIIFKSDDGSGGTATYFYLDGGNTRVQFNKDARFVDNANVMLGTGGDLVMKHDGTDSLVDNYTGELYIRQQSDDKKIIFQTDDGSGGVAEYFRVDGLDNLNIFSVSTKFLDNVKVKVGTSSDLEIYHDGSNSYIKDAGTGILYIQADNQLRLDCATTGEKFARFYKDGAAELFHDNTKRFETSASGVTITGVAVTDGLDMGDDEKIRIGDGQDLQLYHDGSHSYIKADNTGDLYIQSFSDDVVIQGADDVFIYTQGGEDAIIARGDGGVQLFYNAVKKLETKNGGVDILGTLDATGNISVSNASPTLTLTDTDNSNDITFNSVGGALVLNSTSDQVFQIGGTEKFRVGSTTATFAGSVTIAQDLTINGTTTTVNTSTLAVEDPLISMAKDNSANSVDVGFYGRYNDGSNRYLGLFADASDTNRFKLFKGTTTEPTTTVDTSATGYEYANLLLAGVEARGNVKITNASSPHLEITDTTNTCTFKAYAQDSNAHIGTMTNHSFVIDTNGTAAITLDTSQNAQFANAVLIADDKKLEFGGAGDLKIYHSAGGNSHIEATTGNLEIKNTTDDGRITFICDDGSGGTETYFYLDGSGGGSQPFTTFPDAAVIAMGTNHDMRFEHTGSTAKIDNYTGDISITNYADDSDINFRCDNGSGGSATYFKLDGGWADGTYMYTNWVDNSIISLGAGNDLQIYHDGSNSYIKETGTGNLYITASERIRFNGANNEALLYLNEDDNVEAYHNGVKRLETTSEGVTISGNITLLSRITFDYNGSGTGNNYIESGTNTLNFKSDGGTTIISTNFSTAATTFSGSVHLDSDSAQLQLGDDNDLQMYHNGANGFINNGTGDFTIQSSDEFIVDAAGEVILDSGSSEIHLKGSGTLFGKFFKSGDNFYINQPIDDKDIIFSGLDGGSSVTALTLDMSDGGKAIFNGNATFEQNINMTDGDIDYVNQLHFQDNVRFYDNGNDSDLNFKFGDTGYGHFRFIDGNGNFVGGVYAESGYFGTLSPDGSWAIQSSNTVTNISHDVNVNGNLTIPSYIYHKDDPSDDTYFGFNGNDNFTVVTAGGNGLVIDSNRKVSLTNNLGIGDSTPSYSIEIHQADPQIRLEETTSGGNKRLDLKVNSSTSNAEIGANQSAQSLILQTAGSDRLTIDSLGKIGVNNSAPNVRFEIGQNDSEVEVLGVRYSTVPAYISSSFDGTYALSTFSTNQYNTSDGSAGWGSMANASYGTASVQIATDTTGGEVRIYTAPGANQDPTERIRVNKDGDVLFGTTTLGTTHAYFESSSNSRMVLSLGTSTTSSSVVAAFKNPNGTVGTISTNASATAYNTSSDYRLKEDLKDFNGLDEVSKIKMYDFKWKSDGSRGYGVMAHELEEVLPQAVSGEKDAEEMQQVDYSKIVPLLVKSIQELQEEVNKLKQQCKCK